MSANFVRISCLLLATCLLPGCGGAETDPASTSTGATSRMPSARAISDAAFMRSGVVSVYQNTGTSPSSRSSRGGRIDTSTPDGTVREAMQAIQDNEFERIWDLLPASMQKNINDVFKDFGNQVDAELWDKSFNLLSRYVSVMIAKEEMVYQTPEMQAQYQQLLGVLGQAGISDTEWMTIERLKTLSQPANNFTTSLLNSELGNSKKLKAFDGRVFCAKSLNSMVGSIRELVETLVKEAAQIEELKSNVQLQMMLSQADLGKLFENVTVRTESQDGDFAVVVIEFQGVPQKLNFVRVDGKWVPEQMGLALPQGLMMAKVMIPGIVAQINAQKPRMLPALEKIEPLIVALQNAKTQEEFNNAYADFNSQAPQLIATAMGMPGLSAMMGGGAVKVSPVKIHLLVKGPVTDEQMSAVISKLEALTDDPARAITLPRNFAGGSGSGVLAVRDIDYLEISPVSDPQAFAESIKFAQDVEYKADSKSIVLSLKFEAPVQPADTPAPDK